MLSSEVPGVKGKKSTLWLLVGVIEDHRIPSGVSMQSTGNRRDPVSPHATESGEREFFVTQLRRLLKLSRQRMYAGLHGPPPPPGANHIPAARMNFVVGGSKHVTLPLANGAHEVDLATGDGHFSPANTWEKHTWETDHQLLCIVPRQQYLRVSYYHAHADGQVNGTYYHTNRVYSDTFRHTLQALESQASIGSRPLLPELRTALVRLALEECLRPGGGASDRKQRLGRRIRLYIENEFQQAITRESIAAHFHLSPSYVSHLFRETCGMTISEHIAHCRLEFARNLLRGTDLTVYQVGSQCGYGNDVHFIRRFRQVHGVAPGRYREQCTTTDRV